MEGLFELGGGSIPGKDHLFDGNLLIGKNNQDAFHISQTAGLTVAVVADGCGSKPLSEVGANIGSKLLVTSLTRQWQRHSALVKNQGLTPALPLILEAARQDILSHLRILAQAMTLESFSQAVCDHFLFTLVGAVICEHGAAFFSIGDGLIVVNGEVLHLGPFPGNEPPYIAYGLLSSRWKDEELRFVVHRTVAAADLKNLQSFLIGTDGAGDLARASTLTLPGFPAESIGPISGFWSENRYFTKTGLRKRLALIQSRYAGIKNGELLIETPRLKDDTTLIVGRRRPAASAEASSNSDSAEAGRETQLTAGTEQSKQGS